MIKAIVRNGAIELLGSLPRDWKDGRKLVVGETTELGLAEAVIESPPAGSTWAEDVETAMAEIPNEDHDLFEAALAKHERESKDHVRRQWGLD